MVSLQGIDRDRLRCLLERCHSLDEKGAYREEHCEHDRREAVLDEISGLTGLINLFSSDLLIEAEKMLSEHAAPARQMHLV